MNINFVSPTPTAASNSFSLSVMPAFLKIL
uniref:Uncharacterized protein n=1 Tax=Rhizophora mucronata TaxID=61149 RepID=A0A2P2PFI9_RHIMU